MKAYACYNKNDEERIYSSSGGIYYLTAKKIISENGIVYAACYDGLDVAHRRIDKIEKILPSCGSKYQPSKLNDTFRQIKEDLKSKKKVLFVGTPCQCGGLLCYIGNNNNLFCLDFICHGIPSKAAWRSYLKQINKKEKLVEINMRDKTSGWTRYSYSWKMRYLSGKEHTILSREICYMKGFISDFYLRPSCYECRFKGINRGTDITMSDYWGVWDIQPEMDDNKGTSLILIHTEKGQKLLTDIKENLVIKEAFLEKAIQYNMSIVRSANRTEKRKLFFKQLQNGEEFEKIIEDLTKDSFKTRIIKKSKNLFKKFLGGREDITQ